MIGLEEGLRQANTLDRLKALVIHSACLHPIGYNRSSSVRSRKPVGEPVNFAGIARGEANMRFPRREFLRLAAGAAALPVAASVARAQAYPSKPIRWIIGFPAGGGADAVARIMEPWLTKRFG